MLYMCKNGIKIFKILSYKIMFLDLYAFFFQKSFWFNTYYLL